MPAVRAGGLPAGKPFASVLRPQMEKNMKKAARKQEGKMSRKSGKMEETEKGKMGQPEFVSAVPEEMVKGQLPKNIRQVGEPDNTCRVYMEDYVYTFVKKSQEYAGSRMQTGILLGRTETVGSENCYFINGAIMVDELWGEKGEIQFTASVWKKIYEDIRTYFPQLTMQGWFIAGQEETALDILSLEKVHRSAFSREESILCLCRGEEVSLWTGLDSGLTELHGFYIYYERNEAMQEYMIGIGQSSPSEHITEEAAVQNFRSIMEKKKTSAHSSNRLMRGISLGVAAAVLFLAVNAWFQNRQAVTGVTPGSGTDSDSIVQAGADVGSSRKDSENTGTPEGSVAQENQESQSERYSDDSSEPVNATENNSMEHNTEESSFSEGNSPENSSGENSSSESDSVESNLPGNHSADNGTVASSGDSVPAGAMVNYYEVKPGDTLVGISLSFYGTLNMVDAICEANGIENPNAIYSGQKIQLP